VHPLRTSDFTLDARADGAAAPHARERTSRIVARVRTRFETQAGVAGALFVAAAFFVVAYAFLPVTFYNEVFTEPVLMLRGVALYRDLIQHHGPGMRYLLMPLALASPGGDAKFFVCVVAVPLFTAGALFAFASRWFGKVEAWMAFGAYLLLQPLFNGWIFWLDTCNGLIAAVVALLLVRPGAPPNSRARSWCAGALLGVGCTVKQTFVTFVLVFAWTSLRRERRRGWFFGGLCAAPAGVLLAEWGSHSLGPFFDSAIVYNLLFKNLGASNYDTLCRWDVLGVAAFVLACGVSLADRRALPLASICAPAPMNVEKAVAAWAAVSLLPLFPRFGWEHFQQALPFVALLLGVQIRRGVSGRAPRTERAALALVLATFAFAVGARVDSTRKMMAFRGAVESYSHRPDVVALGDRIAARTTPGERIYIWGSDFLPAYVLADRLPAARDLYPFPWMFDEARLVHDLESTFHRQGRLTLFLADATWSELPALRRYLTAEYDVSSPAGSTLRIADHRH
jgi:hypothetical protein